MATYVLAVVRLSRMTSSDWRDLPAEALEEVIRRLPDAVIAADEDGVLTAWNEGAEKLYGWAAHEVLGRRVEEVARPDLSEEDRARARRELHERGTWRAELLACRKDGSPVRVELINAVLHDADGRRTGYAGVHRDVSQRTQLEAEQQRLVAMVQNSGDFIGLCDLDWKALFLNQAGQRLVGLSGMDEVRATTVLDYFAEEERAFVKETVFPQLMRDGRWAGELSFRHFGSGASIPVLWDAFRIDDPLTGAPSCVATVTRDMTERRAAELALRDALRRNATILESITDDFVAVDREWRFTYINERALERLRREAPGSLTREELLGRVSWDVFPGLVGSPFHQNLLRAQRERRTVEFDAHFPGSDAWLEVHAYPSDDGLSIYSRRITERKRAERETRERTGQQAAVAALGLRALSDRRLPPLIDESVALVARTLDVHCVGISEGRGAGADLVHVAGTGWRPGTVGEREPSDRGSQAGYTVLHGEPVIAEDLGAETRFAVAEFVRRHGAMSAASVVIPGREGPYGVLAAYTRSRRAFSGNDVHFLQAVANVLASALERSAAERDLRLAREAERNRIARDLHDEALRHLTQPLAEADQARDAATPAEATDRLGNVVRALKRVGLQLRAAIYDLRLPGGGDRSLPEALNSLVERHRSAAAGCEVRLELEGAMPTGPLGHRGTEVMRIVGEALTNARRHSGARVIRVRVRAEGRLLRAEVVDDGRGFDTAVRPSPTSGTGIIGMNERAALVQGRLSVRSAPGRGTSVRLELPSAAEPGDPAQHVRILLVEDHAAVREAMARAFGREAGFTVVGQAASLAEARRMLDGVDVAVVDLGLPDGYGGTLIEELREANPGAQALVLSASLDHAELARAIESGAGGALDKTVHLDEVVDAVRRLRAGETLLPLGEVVELLRFAGRQKEREYRDRQALASITAREREVLQALADGLDSRGVAQRLTITVRTERNHIANILAKLGVHSQLQALLLALRYGMVEIPQLGAGDPPARDRGPSTSRPRASGLSTPRLKPPGRLPLRRGPQW